MPGTPKKTESQLSPAKRALFELRASQLRDRDGERPGPRRLPGEGPFPQSSAQRRLWLLDRLHPGMFAYNSGRVMRIRGPLDTAALEAALAAVVGRHEAIRTALGAEGDEAVQWIRAAPPIALECIDLAAAGDPETEAVRLARDALRRPFDLGAGLLLRARLLRTAPDEHVLVLVFHHAASDEDSKGIVFADLAHGYQAARLGRRPELSPPPIRYADYAGWEREYLAGGGPAEGLAWWRAELDGAPAELELPADRPRPPVSSFAGARLTELIPAADLASARSVARSHGVTLFTVLLAALDVLLGRLCASEDVVVGAPVSGREHPDLAGIVGPFGNTVVVRTSLAGDPSFGELLRRVHDRVGRALAHQQVPFELLVEELAGGRDLSTPPLAQVLFNFIEHPSAEVPELPGLELTPLEVDPGATKVDLALVASVRGSELRLLWEYSGDLFDRSTVAALSRRLRRLLVAACSRPDTPIGALPLLSAEETAEITGALEATAAPVPAECVHEAVARLAREAPEAPAVRCGDRVVGYGELDARARAIAAQLARAGVAPGSVVALRIGRSIDLPAAMLGVHLAGCAYLPLDEALPPRRRAAMLEDSGAVAVLVDPGASPEPGVASIELAGVAASAHDPGEAPPVSLEDAAYLIYTSGSTGEPKGVVVEHRQLLNLLASMCRRPGVGPGDVLLAVTPLSFDIAALELLAPLLAGATVVVGGEGIGGDPAQLAAAFAATGATIMQATPSTWRLLVDTGWTGDRGLRALCGGEALTQPLAGQLSGRVGELWNMYGPTETTVWSTCWRVTDEARAVPIGQPIANTACYVLDGHDRPLPPGAVGELCIAGAGVARGYHRRPELEAARFVADPFHPGQRMYRTGDRARARTDGALLYLGRSDDEVKLRGVRIALGEIEAVVGRAPGAGEVAVSLRELGGEAGLVAYHTGTADAERLRAFAREELPAVMVPSAWVRLERLPRTANGKLDRAGLPAPVSARPADAPPASDLEQRLASVFAATLGVTGVGRSESFFKLGGQSLSAARAVARLNTELGTTLPLRALFEAPTVAGLAALIGAAASPSAPPPAPGLRASRSRYGVGRWALGNPAALAAILGAAEIDEDGAPAGDGGGGDPEAMVFPATFQQRRVWFLDRLEGRDGLYAVPLFLALDGPVSGPRLAQALDALAARHEALRTTLVEHDGVPLQVVHPPGRFALAQASAGDEEEARALLRDEARRPFDLARGPLARALLVAVGDERQLLGLVLHHAVADGASLGVLVDDLTALLAGREPGPAAQYGDYAVWQRRLLDGPRLDAELAWWRRTLEGAPGGLDLPLDHPRPALSRHIGARHVGWLPAELTRRLEAFAAEQGATLFMTLLAAVQVLLSRRSGQADLVVGTPVSGRDHPGLDGVVGYLANTLVVRTRLADDPGFAEAVERVRRATLDGLEHADLPFDRLVEELAPERDLSRNPLFQVLVAMQDDRPPLPRIEGASVSLLDLDRGVARFDLSVSFARRENRLRVAWEYDTDLLEAASVQRFDSELRCLLEGALTEPRRGVSHLPLMSDEDRRALRGILDASPVTPATLPVHEFVAARAAQCPSATAVRYAGREISYGELDARANQLAGALIARGVGPGVLVGLLIDRSPELIVAIQAVLRAGGAYVPLDPGHPPERIAFTLDDAAVRILLTAGPPPPDLRVAPAELLRLDDPALAKLPTASPGRRSGPDDLAYVIYTSGSTGRPKGVMVAHRGLAALLEAMSAHPGLEAGETMLGLTTPAFDLSVPDLYLPLVRGARMALATPEQALDPDALAALILEDEVTVMQATPATWRMLLDTGWTPPRPMRVVVGGEAVPVDVATRLRDLVEEAWNFYGPTEATVWATRWRITGAIEGEVPIGRPLPGTRLAILDPAGVEVPPGAVGELFIGGVGVARGYLRRPELTAERFLPDPAEPSALRYRTGDLVRLRADGQLGFVGRDDHQVKLRGFRIELGEITSTLERQPGVRAAVAVVREDRPGDPRLVAYVAGPSSVEAVRLQEALARSLPGYMLPSAIVQLAELPLTANGKLDRSALPAPTDSDRPPPVAPRTPVEEQLLAIWSDVLGRDDLGIHDNLFHLGAHSLLVTRAVARIRSALGVELPLRNVFETPTIAELAGTVVSSLVSDGDSPELELLLAELEARPETGA